MGELSVDDHSSQIKNDANAQDENKEVSPSLAGELRNFLAHIISLAVTLPIAVNAVREIFERKKEETDNFEKNLERVGDDKENTIRILTQLLQQTKELRAYSLAFKTIPRSSLMSLISQYDAFLGGLVRVILVTRPEILNTSERNLTFTQLIELKSVESAKEFIMEKEIESFLRKSHAEQFDWMEAKFNLPLRKGLGIWPDFIEITERRNLFVHTGGFVSTQYLKVCKEHNALLKDIKNGDELHVSFQYFEHAFEVVFEIGFKLVVC